MTSSARREGGEVADCAHCGLPVDARGGPVEEGEQLFCCTGCRAVHQAIEGAGLEAFYELRGNGASSVRPPVSDGGGEYADFDTEPFLERHTELEADGTRRATLHLQGVHCAGCVWLVERMRERIEGVVEARLNLARARLTVRWRPEEVELSTMCRWLEQFGYVARPAGAGDREGRSAERALLRRVGVSWAIAANVMLLAFALYAGLEAGDGAGLFTAFRWLSLVLTTGVVVYGGSTFFARAWGSIRPLLADPTSFDVRQLSIDIPISLGIVGGYLHSAAATVAGTGEVWFDSIAVLVAALLTARWLQVRGQELARASADRLFELLPTAARRVVDQSEDGEEGWETVAVEELGPGDVVEVGPGEKVPVDGRIVSGSTDFEMGMLTGESRAEPVRSGDRVYAGSKNVGEAVRVRAETEPGDSRVGRLRDWIEGAGETTAPLVERADRWAGIFVLAVLFAAAVVWTGWTLVGSDAAMRHTVALLVISCPCALGMATPLAMTIGVGRAARRGIFVKEDAVFENLRRLDELVVDKTGTLTRGTMTVVEVEGSAEALRRAAALERESSHPVGRALHRWGSADGEPISEVQEFSGDGIAGRVGDRRVAAGRPDWIAGRVERGLPAALRRFVDAAAADGHTPVVVEVDGEARAAAALADPIRPRAREFLERLEQEGVEVTMLSGDHPRVVETVADALGLPASRASGHVSPEQKRAFVEGRRRVGSDGAAREGAPSEERRLVGMLGDGVNDAAAMKMADVGIAVGGSASPSVVAADVYVAGDGIEPLFALWDGSAGVRSAIRRNVAMSLAYNTVGVSVAAAGLVSPLAAAIAMPLSSVAVVLSSILQSSFRSEIRTESRVEHLTEVSPERAPAPAERPVRPSPAS